MTRLPAATLSLLIAGPALAQDTAAADDGITSPSNLDATFQLALDGDLLHDTLRAAALDPQLARDLLAVSIEDDGPSDVTARAKDLLVTLSPAVDRTPEEETWGALAFEMKDHHYVVYA